jgi:hypothetical protein
MELDAFRSAMPTAPSVEENAGLREQLVAVRQQRDEFRRALEQRIGEADERYL